jgi:RNA polymerase sigma-70 factor, ECF subfamily
MNLRRLPVVYQLEVDTTDDEVELMRNLHDEQAAALWNYCLRLTRGDHAHAEDVVQESLVRAWRHPDVLDRSPEGRRAWLFTVARNIVIDDWRSGRSRREVVVEDAEHLSDTSSDNSNELLQSWLVADAMRSLSADHRAVLVECFYRDHSVAETARRLDIPEGTVKSRTHSALRALRLALEELGAGL